MSKRFTLTQTTIFTLFFIFGLSVFSYGQTTDLQGDLQKSFKDFNLVKFNNRTALQSVQTENRLSIPTGARNFELNLTPNDLRAPRYRAENTDGSGIQTIENNAAVTTFKGTVSGEAGSEARMSIDGAKIEGYFISGGEMFIVEQARKFSPSAGKEDYVVYRQQDILNPQSFTCDADVSEKIEQGKELIAVSGVQSPQAIRVIEMATEADFEFVNTLGGAGAANQEILNILNMVDGVYQNELSLSIKVVYQHTWTTQDPFNPASANTLLTSFQSYWNTNLPATAIPRDAAHLFSGRAAYSGVGLAYIGVVCKSPANAYGFTGRINVTPLKFELAAHEIGHNLGANHVDATQSCANTIMNATLTDTTPFTFCAYSRTEITTFVSANSGCLSAPVPVRNRFDFDGDKRAEIAVFRPSNGAWYIRNSNTGGFTGVLFGQAGDKPVAADYDGDGRTDLAVFRGGNWFRLNSSNGAFVSTAFGFSTDLPVPADFDGDGAADIAVFRPSNGAWYILSSISGNFSGVTFGQSGDVPLPADYDGDGRADVNVFRPSNGAWYRLNSSNGNFTGVTFGQSGDIPIAGDFDGDGRADNVVFRTSNGAWYILKSRDFSFTGLIFGFGSDTPIAADYDGDGITDIAVFRPSEGAWYRINSTTGGFVGVQFGIDTDIPIEAY